MINRGGRRGQLRSIDANRLKLAQEEIQHAWSESDPYFLIARTIEKLVGGVVCFGTWNGRNQDMMNLMGYSGGLSIEDVENTDYFSKGKVLKHRPYNPRKRDPSANRFIENQMAIRIDKAAYRVFIETLLDPLGYGPYCRSLFYKKNRFLSMCGIVRPKGDTPFKATDLRLLDSLVPTLVEGMAARRHMDEKGYAQVNVTSIADALDSPAFIASEAGTVVYCNAIARAFYPRRPGWIRESLSKGIEWVKCVPLILEDTRLFLLIPEQIEVDPELAPFTHWSARWKLPPRYARVAACLMLGMSDKEISERLGLSFHTIRTYIRGLFRRTGVGSRTELIAAVLRQSKPKAR